jgi:hypothetical protein
MGVFEEADFPQDKNYTPFSSEYIVRSVRSVRPGIRGTVFYDVDSVLYSRQ